MLICDRCEHCFHPDCLSEEERARVHDGPWFCSPCRGHVILYGCEDVTMDFGLIDYLFDGTLPANPQESERITKLAGQDQYRTHGTEL